MRTRDVGLVNVRKMGREEEEEEFPPCTQVGNVGRQIRLFLSGRKICLLHSLPFFLSHAVYFGGLGTVAAFHSSYSRALQTHTPLLRAAASGIISPPQKGSFLLSRKYPSTQKLSYTSAPLHLLSRKPEPTPAPPPLTFYYSPHPP